MSEKLTGKVSKHRMNEADWKRFHAMSDEEIDTSDIPELEINDNFWYKAKVIKPLDEETTTEVTH